MFGSGRAAGRRLRWAPVAAALLVGGGLASGALAGWGAGPAAPIRLASVRPAGRAAMPALFASTGAGRASSAAAIELAEACGAAPRPRPAPAVVVVAPETGIARIGRALISI